MVDVHDSDSFRVPTSVRLLCHCMPEEVFRQPLRNPFRGTPETYRFQPKNHHQHAVGVFDAAACQSPSAPRRVVMLVSAYHSALSHTTCLANTISPCKPVHHMFGCSLGTVLVSSLAFTPSCLGKCFTRALRLAFIVTWFHRPQFGHLAIAPTRVILASIA